MRPLKQTVCVDNVVCFTILSVVVVGENGEVFEAITASAKALCYPLEQVKKNVTNEFKCCFVRILCKRVINAFVAEPKLSNVACLDVPFKKIKNLSKQRVFFFFEGN